MTTVKTSKSYTPVDITEITDAKHSGKALQFSGRVGYKETVPFLAYDEVKMTCTPDDSKAPCSKCPNAAQGFSAKTIGAESSDILKFINLPEEKVLGVFKSISKVPGKCMKASFTRGTSTNLVRGNVLPIIESWAGNPSFILSFNRSNNFSPGIVRVAVA